MYHQQLLSANPLANVPPADNTYDLGSGSFRWKDAFIAGTLAFGLLSGSAVLDDATGEEIAYSFAYTTNKATSGDDYGLRVDWTDTASPGTSWPFVVRKNGVSDLLRVRVAGNDTLIETGVVNSQYRLLSGTDGIWTATYFQVPSTARISWSSTTNATAAVDVALYREAAGALALRNGANAQEFRLYKTYTDASNYERLAIDAQDSATSYDIRTESLGTGTTTRNIRVYASGQGTVALGTNNLMRWRVDSTGQLMAELDNTYDIGAAAATRPRTIYVGTEVRVTNNAALTAAGAVLRASVALQWTSNTVTDAADLYLYRDAAGILAQRNGVNAQEFRLYGTYTDASNYERLTFEHTGAVAAITSEAAGTGTATPLALIAAAGVLIEPTASGDTPEGTLHIRTGSAGSPATAHSQGDDLVIESDASGGITILTPSTLVGSIFFAHQSKNVAARLSYNQSINELRLGTDEATGYLRLYTGAAVQALIIDADQRWTSGAAQLNNATGAEIAYSFAYTTNKATSGNDYGLVLDWTDTASPGESILFETRVGGSPTFQIRGLTTGWVNLYNAYTDDSNFERLQFGAWAGNVAYIATRSDGTGTGRDLQIGTETAPGVLKFRSGAVAWWTVDNSGHIFPQGGTQYIGSSSAYISRLYVTNLYSASVLSMANVPTISWGSAGSATRIFLYENSGSGWRFGFGVSDALLAYTGNGFPLQFGYWNYGGAAFSKWWEFAATTGHLVPAADSTYDIGTATLAVRTVYTDAMDVKAGTTVAGLPGTPTVGMIRRVTDASGPAVGSTVVGGGAAAALVWYNGSAWTVIGV